MDVALERRFLIVYNPLAGSSKRQKLANVVRRLRVQGCTVELRSTGSPDECQRLIRSIAAQGDYDAVVAAGGDGTVRTAAAALAGTDMPLGIIPIGTGNVMAHEIGLKMHSRAIADCLIKGDVAQLSTAYANGEPFYLMVGAGFDGRVIGWLDAAFKRRVGKLAYTWPVIRGVLAGPDVLKVRIDDREHEAGWAVATMGRRYAGSFVLAPNAQLDGNNIQTVLFHAPNRLSMVSQLVEVAAGRIEKRGDIEHVAGDTIEITSSRPVPVQIDGEPFGSTPVHIKTGGPVLNLIAPL